MRNLIYKLRLMLIGVFVALGAGALAQITPPPVQQVETFTSLTMRDDINSTITFTVDNDNNGTTNTVRTAWLSGDANAAMYVAGSGRTSTIIAGGPIGSQAVLRTLGAYPIVFGTGNTQRMSINGSGSEIVVNATVFDVNGTAPVYEITESDATANEGIWRLTAVSDSLRWITYDDVPAIGSTFMTINRTGTNVDDINWATDDFQINGDSYNETGTFTITLDTGCTTNPTGTATYARNGDVVVLELPTVTCTSNSLSKVFLADLPVSIRPTTTQLTFCAVQEDTVIDVGICFLATNGDIELRVDPSQAFFTNTGSDGVIQTTVTYLLN